VERLIGSSFGWVNINPEALWGLQEKRAAATPGSRTEEKNFRARKAFSRGTICIAKH